LIIIFFFYQNLLSKIEIFGLGIWGDWFLGIGFWGLGLGIGLGMGIGDFFITNYYFFLNKEDKIN